MSLRFVLMVTMVLPGCAGGCGKTLEPATDPVPASYGTPAESVAQAGEWVGRHEQRALPLEHDECSELYRRAAETPRGGPESLLVCRVEASRERSYEGAGKQIATLGASNAPELRVAVAVGDEPAAMQAGEDNEHVACVTLPLVTLSPGDAVRLALYDDDTPLGDGLGGELIGAGSGAFAGSWPLEVTGEHFTATCLAAPKAEGEWRLTHSALPILDSTVSRLREVGAKDGTQPPLARFADELAQARKWVDYGVRYVGWAEPRLAKRRRAVREAVVAVLAPLAPESRPKPAFSFGGEALTGLVDAVVCRPGEAPPLAPQVSLDPPLAWPEPPARSCRLGLTMHAAAGPDGQVLPGNRALPLVEAELVTRSGDVIPLEAAWWDERAGDGVWRPLRDAPGNAGALPPPGTPIQVRLDPPRALDFEGASYGGAWLLLLGGRLGREAREPQLLPLGDVSRSSAED